MKGKIIVNENRLKKIVSESVKKVLSEVSWQTGENAADAAQNLDFHYAEKVRESFKTLMSVYVDYLDELFGGDWKKNYNSQAMQLYNKLESLQNEMKSFLNRKGQQAKNLKSMADKKFSDENGNMSYDSSFINTYKNR